MTPAGVPMVKPRELVRALERMGFRLLRKSKGSHWQFEHPDGRRTTVPVHKGCDVGPGLLRKILRDIELDWENLQKMALTAAAVLALRRRRSHPSPKRLAVSR